MFVVRPARMLSSAALFCLAVPAVAAAQGPLAGLVSRVIAESTINRSQPNRRSSTSRTSSSARAWRARPGR